MGFFSSEENTNQTQVQNTSQQVAPWAAQDPFLRSAFQRADQAYTNASGAPRPDNFIAGLTPEQTALFRQMYGAGSGAAGSLTSGGVDAFSRGMSGLSGFAPTSFQTILDNAGSAASSPYTQGMVDAATRDARDAAGYAVRGNNQAAAASGNINGSRAGIRDALIADRLGRTVGDISSNIRGKAYSDAMSTALSSALAGDSSRIGAAGSLLTGGISGVGAGAGAYDVAGKGATGLQQGNQLSLDDQLARYQFGTQSPFDALNNYFKIIGGQNWGSSTTGTSTTTGTKSVEKDPSTMAKIGSSIGAISEYAPMALGALSFFSDRRVKRDIKRVGTLDNGLPVYTYRYLGDQRVQMGVMAQEVEQVRPEAVSEIAGIKLVNYGML